MLIPSSSSNGGSSSKPVDPPPPMVVDANCGVENEVEAAADPTSKDMKGIPGFDDFGG